MSLNIFDFSNNKATFSLNERYIILDIEHDINSILEVDIKNETLTSDELRTNWKNKDFSDWNFVSYFFDSGKLEIESNVTTNIDDIQGAIRVCSGSIAALPKVLKSGLKRANHKTEHIQNAIDAWQASLG